MESQAKGRLDKLIEHLQAPVARSGDGERGSALEPKQTVASDDDSFGSRAVDLYKTLTADMPFSAKRHGGQLVAKVLQAHGVKFIFTLSGGHISPILCASEELGIRIIDVRHEVTSVFAADAVARLTGTCGVAAVTAGPGITNTITALKNAQMAESPLILLGGAAATLTRGRGALQDVDQMSVLKSVCKHTVTITSTRDIVPALRRAFREAMSGVPGPCFVELPLDVLYPITEAQSGMGLTERKYKKLLEKADYDRIMVPVEFRSKEEYLASLGPLEAVFLERATTNQPFIVDQFMKFKVRSLFAGGWEATEFGPLPVDVPQPNEGDIARCVEFLRSAKNPVLLIGSQATLGGPEGAKKLQEAVEALGIPTFLGGMARGLLGAKSDTQIRQNRGQALKKADLILLAGSVCDFRLGYGRELPTSAKIVTINRGRAQGTMNMGMFWNAALVSVSDPGLFVRGLASKAGSLNNRERFAEWRASLKQAEKKKDESNRKKAEEIALGRVPLYENGPTKADDSKNPPELINPLKFLLAVEDALPDNAILVADGGDFVATASYILKPRGPLMWLDPGAFGTLGVGGGFALGAKLACPEREVWLLWGDGSSGYSIAEMDTFTKHKCPIIAVIGNDAAWAQIEREQVPMFNSDAACALKYLDYDAVAKGYGADGILIKDPKANFAEALGEARRKHAAGAPVVVNALIGRTNFREGSISV